MKTCQILLSIQFISREILSLILFIFFILILELTFFQARSVLKYYLIVTFLNWIDNSKSLTFQGKGALNNFSFIPNFSLMKFRFVYNRMSYHMKWKHAKFCLLFHSFLDNRQTKILLVLYISLPVVNMEHFVIAFVIYVQRV